MYTFLSPLIQSLVKFVSLRKPHLINYFDDYVRVNNEATFGNISTYALLDKQTPKYFIF